MGKKNKTFLPKKIAGVKVPKSVRKGRLGGLLASPRGQTLIAEAVMAAGAVAGAKKVADNPEAPGALSKTADKVRRSQDARRGATDAGDALAYALIEAARSFTEALKRHRPEDGDGGWAETTAADRGEAESKKNLASYEAAPL